jgi:hypothetical protein
VRPARKPRNQDTEYPADQPVVAAAADRWRIDCVAYLRACIGAVTEGASAAQTHRRLAAVLRALDHLRPAGPVSQTGRCSFCPTGLAVGFTTSSLPICPSCATRHRLWVSLSSRPRPAPSCDRVVYLPLHHHLLSSRPGTTNPQPRSDPPPAA